MGCQWGKSFSEMERKELSAEASWVVSGQALGVLGCDPMLVVIRAGFLQENGWSKTTSLSSSRTGTCSETI